MDVKGPNTSYAWMLTANIVTAACASPFLGRVGDIFGRRPVLLVANAVGVVGCVVSATAHNVNTVIGASVLIGLSSAMHQNAWACLGEIVPRKSRAMALGIFQSSSAPGSAFGALIGNCSSLPFDNFC
jgi:MFS family permease